MAGWLAGSMASVSKYRHASHFEQVARGTESRKRELRCRGSLFRPRARRLCFATSSNPLRSPLSIIGAGFHFPVQERARCSSRGTSGMGCARSWRRRVCCRLSAARQMPWKRRNQNRPRLPRRRRLLPRLPLPPRLLPRHRPRLPHRLLSPRPRRHPVALLRSLVTPR